MMERKVRIHHSAFQKVSKKFKKTSKKVLTKGYRRGIIVKLLRARAKRLSESERRTLKTIQERKRNAREKIDS